jgi:hypothetical protein
MVSSDTDARNGGVSMFVDVISGSTENPHEMQRRIGEWVTDIAPHTPGWRGTTAGVAADGTFVAMTRIDAEVAPAPAHDQWRTATLALLAGDRSSLIYDRVNLLEEQGDVGSAEFVQFVLGRVRNTAESHRYLTEFDAVYAPLRPDCVGRLMAGRDDGRFIGAFYFTSEEEARAAEGQEMSPEIVALIERGETLSDGPAIYIDLTRPWIHRPPAASTPSRQSQKMVT